MPKKNVSADWVVSPSIFHAFYGKERDQIPQEPRLTPNSAASLSSLRDIIKLNGLKLRYIYILKTKVPRFLKKSDSKKLKVSLRNINGSRPESHREAKFGVVICLFLCFFLFKSGLGDHFVHRDHIHISCTDVTFSPRLWLALSTRLALACTRNINAKNLFCRYLISTPPRLVEY